MKLGYSNIEKDLLKISEYISDGGLKPELIAYIGNTPKEIGEFFAKFFRCETCFLPSLRKKRNKSIAKMINPLYNHLPAGMLKIISQMYKTIYSMERIPPKDFELDKRFYDRGLILLVDDNTQTGRTLETWKRKIKDKTGKSACTFSLAVSGNYKPDYYCFDKWRSFKWRPIGI